MHLNPSKEPGTSDHSSPASCLSISGSYTSPTIPQTSYLAPHPLPGSNILLNLLLFGPFLPQHTFPVLPYVMVSVSSTCWWPQVYTFRPIHSRNPHPNFQLSTQITCRSAKPLKLPKTELIILCHLQLNLLRWTLLLHGNLFSIYRKEHSILTKSFITK